MIALTGAAGFIGSCLARMLNDAGADDLLLVDDFSEDARNRNLSGKRFREKIDFHEFPAWFRKNGSAVTALLHLGAKTDTTVFDKTVFDRLNRDYSKKLWDIAAAGGVPFIYASSAATYGAGEHGYDDDETLIPTLAPLNPYGQSKQDFDLYVLSEKKAGRTPPRFAGLKFFNVYGPNEYHKGRMASVVYRAFRQIQETGSMTLFRSHRPEYHDGGQKRDFIYVKDIGSVCRFFMESKAPSGIYNVGTGTARTFLDLANATFSALGRAPAIEFVDMPSDIRDRYQYFTEARVEKLRAAGYAAPFTPLAAGIRDYIGRYLDTGSYF